VTPAGGRRKDSPAARAPGGLAGGAGAGASTAARAAGRLDGSAGRRAPRRRAGAGRTRGRHGRRAHPPASGPQGASTAREPRAVESAPSPDALRPGRPRPGALLAAPARDGKQPAASPRRLVAL